MTRAFTADQLIALARQLPPSEQRRVWIALRPETLGHGPATLRAFSDARFELVHRLIRQHGLAVTGRSAWVMVLDKLWSADPSAVLTRPLRQGETLDTLGPFRLQTLTIKPASLRKGYLRWLARTRIAASCPPSAA